MNLWRLIAHHESSKEAAAEMVRRNVLAVGWSDIGDLSSSRPGSAREISKMIAPAHPAAENAQLGGPSLWNLYARVSVGDFVIVNAMGRRLHVFEVAGGYFYADDADAVLGYRHQREAYLTDIDPETLWKSGAGPIAKGQNVRWTLVGCFISKEAEEKLHFEGERYEIRTTSIERSRHAREACIAHYRALCFVCGFDFKAVYGSHGEGYIHVHHREDLAQSKGRHEVDPVRDLVPLCPNCHAMVHWKRKVAMAVDDLKELMRRRVGGQVRSE
jgi:hypothetical protein